MPIAVFKSVREVSSADATHCAENLLKQEIGKKWRTARAGEKTATVILELQRPQQIIGIDIGNEHSAFVEVLVGRSFDNFTEILPTCSFMTPSESKSSTQINRVRCFHRDVLIPQTVEEKWNLVKVICTQPFNTHVPYGLSFIKLHVAESADVDGNQTQKAKCQQPNASAPPTKTTAGLKETTTSKLKLTLRPESPDSESESASSLFNRWRTARHSDGTLAAPAPTQPTAAEKRKSLDDKPRVLDRNRESLLFGDDDDGDKDATTMANSAKLKRLEKFIEHDKQRQRDDEAKQKPKTDKKPTDQRPATSSGAKVEATPKTPKDKTHDQERTKRRKAVSPSPTTSQQHQQHQQHNMPAKKQKTTTTTPQRPPAAAPPAPQPQRTYRPFHELLKGVVLVISGIQNPERADLRNKALALGAKYKADWSSDCTHLICAFRNTPKYNQVKGKGKIITKSWLEQCYKLKKYLPWRRYALESTEQAKAESDEELWDVALQPAEDMSDIEPSAQQISKTTATTKPFDNTLAMYDQNDDNVRVIESGSDTDDEIQRVILKKPKVASPAKVGKALNADVFDADTEEEDYLPVKMRGVA